MLGAIKKLGAIKILQRSQKKDLDIFLNLPHI